MVVCLYDEGWSFYVFQGYEDQIAPVDSPADILPYDDGLVILDAVENGQLCHEIVDLVEDSSDPNIYHNGTLLAEVRDYRSVHVSLTALSQPGEIAPVVTRVTLKPTQEVRI